MSDRGVARRHCRRQQPLRAQCKIAKFDLTFFVTEFREGIDLEIEYNTDLFDSDRIERMVGHLQTLLEAASQEPERRIAELPMLTVAERRMLLDQWNPADEPYPS